MISRLPWSTFVFVCLSLLYCVNAFNEDRPDGGTYQYQSSFHGPYSGTHIPFWEVGGATIVADDYVRLTPNEQSRKGYIWSTRPMRYPDWQIQLSIAIGSPGRLGADGMALWYTSDRGLSGPVYGGPDRWEGLGIMFDTFDNDGKRDNPAIYGVFNDGSRTFDPTTDGRDSDMAIGRCVVTQLRQVSATPEQKWAKVRVRYQGGELSVSYDLSELTNTNPNFVECFRSKVNLPKPGRSNAGGFFFGLTAETGGLSDFHDVRYLTTWSFRPEQQQYQQQPPYQQQQQPPYQQQQQPPFQQQQQQQQQPPFQQQQQPPFQQQQQPPYQKPQPPANQQQPPSFQQQQPPSFQQPPPSFQQQQPPPPSYQQQQAETVAVPEVMNRLRRLEQKEQEIIAQVESKFRTMEEGLGHFEQTQADTLTRLQQNLEALTQRMDTSNLNEIKNDLKNTLTAITHLQTRMTTLQSQVEGTTKRATDLQRMHETRSEQLSSLVEKSSSWGFWTFFLIFQLFFAIAAFVWWKKVQDDKNKKDL